MEYVEDRIARDADVVAGHYVAGLERVWEKHGGGFNHDWFAVGGLLAEHLYDQVHHDRQFVESFIDGMQHAVDKFCCTMTTRAHADLAESPEVLPGVFDHGGDFRRYSVLLELQVSADNPEQANDRAMAWVDRRGNVVEAKPLDFDWHMHGPDGC